MDGYGPLLETLMTFEPAVHVFGGFAEDALLHGTSVRSHDDVDVLVGREELKRNSETLAGSGSHHTKFASSRSKGCQWSSEPATAPGPRIACTTGRRKASCSSISQIKAGGSLGRPLRRCLRLPPIGSRWHRRRRYPRSPCIRSARGSRWREVSDHLARRMSPRRKRFAPGSSPTLRPRAFNRR